MTIKVAVAGTRGVPEVQGGVETHCSELYPRLAALGADVTVMCRRPYMSHYGAAKWRGVKLCTLYSPAMRSAEAVAHTALAVIKAWRQGCRIVHLHSCGPALLTPLVRILGMKAVVTYHGASYKFKEWGPLARAVMRLGEKMALHYASAMIFIAPGDYERLKGRCRRSALVMNGVNCPEPTDADTMSRVMDEYGLSRGRYILAVGRLVETKGFHLLIKAWKDSGVGIPLVIAGGADHPTAYSEALSAQARKEGVVMTGRVDSKTLGALYDGAAMFAMSSLHEGLPIALLEAMSHRLDAVVCDIESCRLPELPDECFANPADTEAFAEALRQHVRMHVRRGYDLRRYSWDTAAERTMEIYRSLL